LTSNTDKDKIALDFIKVYKKYKDKSFRKREIRNIVGEVAEKKTSRRRNKLDKINPENQ
jgi:hypothetical protein